MVISCLLNISKRYVFFVFFRHVTPYVNNEAILQLSWSLVYLLFSRAISHYITNSQIKTRFKMQTYLFDSAQENLQ